MATSLPTNIDGTYPDAGSAARALHQQHHDTIHGYTNAHDTATDPHGDRAAAAAADVAALAGHTAAADPHPAYLLPSEVAEASVATSQGVATTSYTDLATAGPAVTVTTGTRALVIISSSMTHAAVGGYCLASVAVSGATTVAAADDRALYFSAAVANQELGASRALVMTGLTAGSNTFTVKYKAGGAAGTATFINRRITVIPL